MGRTRQLLCWSGRHDNFIWLDLRSEAANLGYIFFLYKKVSKVSYQIFIFEDTFDNKITIQSDYFIIRWHHYLTTCFFKLTMWGGEFKSKSHPCKMISVEMIFCSDDFTMKPSLQEMISDIALCSNNFTVKPPLQEMISLQRILTLLSFPCFSSSDRPPLFRCCLFWASIFSLQWSYFLFFSSCQLLLFQCYLLLSRHLFSPVALLFFLRSALPPSLSHLRWHFFSSMALCGCLFPSIGHVSSLIPIWASKKVSGCPWWC